MFSGYIYIVLQSLVIACSCNLLEVTWKLTHFEAKLGKIRRNHGQRKTKKYISAVDRLTISACSYQYSLF